MAENTPPRRLTTIVALDVAGYSARTEADEARSTAEVAAIGVADWVSRRKSELDDRDPEQRYFVNEALDALIRKKLG